MNSVCATYFMLCRILHTFEMLQSGDFCTDYFSILLESEEEPIAKITKIPKVQLEALKVALEAAMAHIAHSQASIDNLATSMEECFLEICDAFLELLCIHDRECLTDAQAILQCVRTIVVLLDLGLVSYAGSHASRFDADHRHRNFDIFSSRYYVQGPDERQSFWFTCQRRKLACLEGFLDFDEVWTFRTGSHEPTSSPCSRQPLLIMTHIEEFADIWGPVWSVPVDPKRLTVFHRHIVSKGVICRTDERARRNDGAIRCHWFDSASYQRRRGALSRLVEHFGGSPREQSLLRMDDLLLIGAIFRDNESCHYTMSEFKSVYNHGLGVLGTERAKWELVERQGSLSFNRLIGVQVTGTQKRRPQTSLKELTMNRWRIPETANPYFFNQYTGVEISHCTGNARRVPFKRLLLLTPVRAMLNLQFPGWHEEAWGRALLNAASSVNDRKIIEFWGEFQTARTNVGQMIFYLVHLLEKTGKRKEGVAAAFFHEQQELSVTFEQKYNDYCCLLKDTHEMATFAVVSDTCIECHTPDHTTSVCGNTRSWTALETRLALDATPRAWRVYATAEAGFPEWIRMNTTGHPFRVVDRESTGDVLLAPGSNARNAGGYILSRCTMATEVPSVDRWVGHEHTVLMRSRTKSYGGMKKPRKRNVPQSIALTNNIGDQAAVNTASHSPGLQAALPIRAADEIDRTGENTQAEAENDHRRTHVFSYGQGFSSRRMR
jgi:hypothetical protein